MSSGPWEPSADKCRDLHPQRQPGHLEQDLFDLVERLPTEVLRLQPLSLRLLRDLPDVLDLRGLHAVCGSDAEIQFVHPTAECRQHVFAEHFFAFEFGVFAGHDAGRNEKFRTLREADHGHVELIAQLPYLVVPEEVRRVGDVDATIRSAEMQLLAKLYAEHAERLVQCLPDSLACETEFLPDLLQGHSRLAAPWYEHVEHVHHVVRAAFSDDLFDQLTGRLGDDDVRAEVLLVPSTGGVRHHREAVAGIGTELDERHEPLGELIHGAHGRHDGVVEPTPEPLFERMNGECCYEGSGLKARRVEVVRYAVVRFVAAERDAPDGGGTPELLGKLVHPLHGDALQHQVGRFHDVLDVEGLAEHDHDACTASGVRIDVVSVRLVDLVRERVPVEDELGVVVERRPLLGHPVVLLEHCDVVADDVARNFHHVRDLVVREGEREELEQGSAAGVEEGCGFG